MQSRGHIAELEPGPRASGSQPRALACGPGCLGVRGQHPSPSHPTLQNKGRWPWPAPGASDSMFTGYNAFGTTRPTFLGMLKDARCPPAVPMVHVHTALFCSPLPRPRHMGSGCFCRRSFLRPTVASYSLLWSICKSHPRESWGSAHFSLALCPEPGGKEGRLGEGHPPLNGPLTWEEAP